MPGARNFRILNIVPKAGRSASGEKSVTASGFPVRKGTENTHAACGHCGAVLAWNESPETIGAIFTSVHRITARCACGHHNLITGRSYLELRLQSAFHVSPDQSFEDLLIELNDSGPDAGEAWTK